MAHPPGFLEVTLPPAQHHEDPLLADVTADIHGSALAPGQEFRQRDLVDSDRGIGFLLHGDDLSHAVAGSDQPFLHRRTTFEASPSLFYSPLAKSELAGKGGSSPEKTYIRQPGGGKPQAASAETVVDEHHQLPSTSIASCPRLSSETTTDSPHSEQRIVPRSNRVVKIISSKVSPSPSAYHGPSSAIRSSTSAAGVSGEAANRQQQFGQNNSTCMARLLM